MLSNLSSTAFNLATTTRDELRVVGFYPWLVAATSWPYWSIDLRPHTQKGGPVTVSQDHDRTVHIKILYFNSITVIYTDYSGSMIVLHIFLTKLS